MATDWKRPLTGVKERKLSTGFTHLRVHYTANPNKRGDWSQRESVIYFGMDSPKWQREQEINYKAYAGQRIWPMLSMEDYNLRIDVKDWSKYRIIDQGIRHPTVCLWVAVNRRDDRHVYREYYATDRSIAFNCREIILLSEGEDIMGSLIDPSTRKRGAETERTLMGVYEDNGIACTPADNSFAGYDAVANAAMSTLARNSLRTGELSRYLAKLKPNQDELLTLAGQSCLTFDLRFASRAFEECCGLRWQETKGDMSQKAEREKPVDKDDDGPDCVRYSVMSYLGYREPVSSTVKIKNLGEIFHSKWKKQRQIGAGVLSENRAYYG